MALATSSISLNITGNASDQLARIQASTANLSSAFGRLQTAIGALALGNVVRSVMAYADGIADVSKATGVSIERVMGFTRAIQANGGSAEGAANMLTKLSLSVEEANDGSQKARDTFAALGVTMNDLATLSDTDLFAKTIAGLGRIQDNSRRAALAVDVLGKGAKGVDMTGVAGDFNAATASSIKYVAGVKAAAEAHDRLQMAFGTFQNSVALAIKPMLDFFNSIDPKKIDQFVAAVVQIGGAAAGIAVLAKSVQILSGLVITVGTYFAASYALAATGAATVAVTVANLGIRWGGFVKAITASTTVMGGLGEVGTFLGNTFGKTIAFILGGFARMIPVVAVVTGVVYALNTALKLIFDIDPIDMFLKGLGNIYDRLREIVGLQKKVQDQTPSGIDTSAAAANREDSSTTQDAKRVQLLTADQLAKKKAAADEALRAAEALEKRNIESMLTQAESVARMHEMVDQYKQLGIQAQEQSTLLKAQLGLDTSLIGKNEQQVELARALNAESEKLIALKSGLMAKHQELARSLEDELALQQKIKAMLGPTGQKEPDKDSAKFAANRQALQKDLDNSAAKIKLLRAEMDQVQSLGPLYERLHQSNGDAIIRQLNLQQGLRMLETDRLNQLNLITQQFEQQQDIALTMSGIRLNLFAQSRANSFNAAQAMRGPFQQAFEKITEDAALATQTAQKNLADKFVTAAGDSMTPEASAALAVQLEQIALGYESVARDQRKLLLTSELYRQSIESVTRASEALQRQETAGAAAMLAIRDRKQQLDFADQQVTKSPFQRQIEQVRENARIAARAAGQAFAAAFPESGDGMSAAQSDEMSRGLLKIADSYKVLADQEIASIERSRTFAAGWDEAMAQYLDSTSNAANAARDIFNTAVKGMEDVIVTFVNTGKLEFGDLLRSLATMLLRSQLQQLMGNLFGGIGKSSSSMFGSMFGGGSGGAGGTRDNVFTDLFGWAANLLGFAAGGMIPNNQPVLVGENGPELLSGAGGRSVTPNGSLGGTTIVTYNINAVDSSSFRSMIASDPEFLFAVTEQGRRRLPTRR